MLTVCHGDAKAANILPVMILQRTFVTFVD